VSTNVKFAVDVDSLEWEPATRILDDHQGDGISAKMLRSNPATGGYAALVRLMPETTAGLGDRGSESEQFLVEGTVVESGRVRHAPAYWLHPPGGERREIRAETTATLLLISSRPTAEGKEPGRPSVTGLDVDALEWRPVSEITPYYPQESLDRIRAFAKLLSQDPETGAFTCLIKLPPGAGDPAYGYHPCDQDTYLLDGDFTMNREMFHAPGYWFCAAGTVHGGSSTEGGAILLERFTGPCELTLVDGSN